MEKLDSLKSKQECVLNWKEKCLDILESIIPETEMQGKVLL